VVAGGEGLPPPSRALISTQAATQSAGRFWNHPRVFLAALVEPLRDAARRQVETRQSPCVLRGRDGCQLLCTYGPRDRVPRTPATDVGSERTTAGLVRADDGRLRTPMERQRKTDDGILSTRAVPPDDVAHVEQVLPTMEVSRTWGLGRPLVHVVDREGDSVDHFRQWPAAGHPFVVRVDDRRVKCAGRSRLRSAIVREMQEEKGFVPVRSAEYQGREASGWLVETDGVRDRPGNKNVAVRTPWAVAGVAFPRGRRACSGAAPGPMVRA
jgi:hypothetical protein